MHVSRAGAAPLISLVIPCFDVAEYLPDFLASLERELRLVAPAGSVESIFVIDGATDDTARLVHGWRSTMAGHQSRIIVIEQENQGLSGARNSGMSAASGRWVSFPDPDDVLGRGYLSRVATFLREAEARRACLVSTNIVSFTGHLAAVTDDHPLRGKYVHGTRVANLREEPEAIQLSAATCFLPLDALRARGLTFDSRIRPSFEDAALIARFLLEEADPTVAVLPGARYLYRRRADGSSLVASSWSRPEKYDDQVRFGYLALLEDAARRGPVPRWLQNTVLYDLSWYFTRDRAGLTATLSSAQAEVFHDLLRDVLALMEPEAIADFDVTPLSDEVRAMLLAIRGAPARTEIRIGPRDKEQQLTRVAFYAPPDRTRIEYSMDGTPVRPVFAKRRALLAFGRTVADEILAWLPGLGQVRVTADGNELSPATPRGRGLLARFGAGRHPVSALVWAARWALTLARFDRERLRQVVQEVDLTTTSSAPRTLTSRIAATLVPRYRDCWLLMDGRARAGGRAEDLARHLREQRPDINAWLVIDRRSPDWKRLRAAGVRLIAYGSPHHVCALAQCRELITSEADQATVSPWFVLWMRRRTWRLTWLPERATDDDSVRQASALPVSLIAVETSAEAAALTGDGTPTPYTGREVATVGEMHGLGAERVIQAITERRESLAP